MAHHRLSVVLLVFLVCAAVDSGAETWAQDQPAPGSPDFRPSPDRPVGWRGDGNGRYPAADPPLMWGRISKAVKELSAQAAKPKAGDKGLPVPGGVIYSWLTLGPVPLPAGKSAKDDLGTNEAGFAPDEGAKFGDLEWKATTLDTSFLNFRPMYDKVPAEGLDFVAYAHAWLYSAEGKPVFMTSMMSSTGKIWLNGKDLGVFGSSPAMGSTVLLPLEKGWNRLLLRVAPYKETGLGKQWHFNAAFLCTEKSDYESQNILWSTPMPEIGAGVGSPILVGDKLFMPVEASGLICVSAKDGKVMWARSSTYADAATPEDRKTNQEVFVEVDQLAAKIKDSLQAYCDAPGKYDVSSKMCERVGAERKINKLLVALDPGPNTGGTGNEAGEAPSTPASDGENVYAVYNSGVVACFDLAGNRKWTTTVAFRQKEHGYAASPCLIDGKVVIKANGYLGAVALDCKTGAVVTPMPVWKNKRLDMHSSPVAMVAGREKLVIQSFGVVTRASDGKILAEKFTPPYYNVGDIVSPTVEGRILCSSVLTKESGGMRFVFQTLPDAITEPLVMKDTKECAYNVNAFPCSTTANHCASPLLYQGLAYAMSADGALTVMDAAKGEVVYQKLLNVSPFKIQNGNLRGGCASSPTLAGKYIYIWDNQGGTVVIEPGRQFKQVARNRIEQPRYSRGHNECTISNPVFSGNRLFYRGEMYLYCLGEKPESGGRAGQ